MPTDIFDFWKMAAGELHIHPADKPTLDRLSHNFRFNCLMGPFTGPLRTASAVFLFRSPGYADFDNRNAQSRDGQDFYLRQRNGNCNLPTNEEHPTFYQWAKEKLDQFGLNYEEAVSTIAFVNLAPYKSSEFTNYLLLQKLPSCIAMLDWTHESLLPAAENGDKIVVCMMAHNAWRLPAGTRRGKGLYSVTTTQRGVMRGPYCNQAIEAVRNAVKR